MIRTIARAFARNVTAVTTLALIGFLVITMFSADVLEAAAKGWPLFIVMAMGSTVITMKTAYEIQLGREIRQEA